VAATLLVTAAGLGIGWGTIAVPMLAGLAAAEHHGLAVLAGFGLSLVASFTVLAVQIGTAQRLRIPWLFGLLLPLGYAFVAALVLNAVWARAQGRVAWKGRLYGGRGGSLRHAP
jgi:hypothetical protein